MTETFPYFDSRPLSWKTHKAVHEQKRTYTTRSYRKIGQALQLLKIMPARSFSPSEKLLQNLLRLHEFARADQGWNGYDAHQFDKQALAIAQELLLNLQFCQPFVSPLTDGGVQFDWEDGARTLELEIYADSFNFLDELGEESIVTDEHEALAHIKSWLNV